MHNAITPDEFSMCIYLYIDNNIIDTYVSCAHIYIYIYILFVGWEGEIKTSHCTKRMDRNPVRLTCVRSGTSVRIEFNWKSYTRSTFKCLCVCVCVSINGTAWKRWTTVVRMYENMWKGWDWEQWCLQDIRTLYIGK